MYDLIVIGAGPSGIMAAIQASKKDKNIIIVEKNSEICKKLLITGGGRCNLTNLKQIDELLKNISVNSKFLKKSFQLFGPLEICQFFSKKGVLFKEEEDNKIFPISNKSVTIMNAMLTILKEKNIKVKYNYNVQNIEKKDNNYIVKNGIEKLIAKKIVIATGGKSYPQTGSNGSGYNFAKNLNHKVIDPYPALTKLITKQLKSLIGITIDQVEIQIGNNSAIGSIIVTHNGISGPAAFKISEHVYHNLINKKNKIIINFIPNKDLESLLFKLNKYKVNKEIQSFFRQFLPVRIVDYIFSINNIDKTKKIATISNNDKKNIIKMFLENVVIIEGVGKIEHSIVTGGGVKVDEINESTMESKIHKGLYFVGELLDVHGFTGGYNITIALSTGYLAGEDIAKK